jgi:hypothetical protein
MGDSLSQALQTKYSWQFIKASSSRNPAHAHRVLIAPRELSFAKAHAAFMPFAKGDNDIAGFSQFNGVLDSLCPIRHDGVGTSFRLCQQAGFNGSIDLVRSSVRGSSAVITV